MKSTDKLYSFFETDYPLNKDGLDELIKSFKTLLFKKGNLLIREGDYENQLRFIVSGAVREYYSSEDKDININFYTSSQFISDFNAFNKSVPTRKYQESLNNVEILVLDKDMFLRFLEKYPCGKSFIELTFQNLLEKKELFEYNRLTKPAEELYKIILKNHPDWFQNVPQYHIASFLGITPETLSRIRKRI
ncbi:Crp/Fnr family transcriptional regulator [Ancylomarina sp. YFZ004]